ncbi:hypothetical protein ACFRQM_40640 [Streptomyces sp. NPDC056831]|uniref:hypothetical protein n=1 Tax=Streptomyces sp. NPDC056831 TaxID=3345954 RepID=UPI0036B1741B
MDLRQMEVVVAVAVDSVLGLPDPLDVARRMLRGTGRHPQLASARQDRVASPLRDVETVVAQNSPASKITV